MPYIVIQTSLPEVLILEPQISGAHSDFVFESFNQSDFNKAIGQDVTFVQDNHSKSIKGVLRGLHYQIHHPQGKLVRCTYGAVFDVAVDLRRSSPNFGKWVGVKLSAENRRQVWIPPGFAHGFLAVTEFAEFLYKTTDYWYPEYERCLLWSDTSIGIKWPIAEDLKLAIKDMAGKKLEDADVFD